jgi:hypothetical protein
MAQQCSRHYDSVAISYPAKFTILSAIAESKVPLDFAGRKNRETGKLKIDGLSALSKHLQDRGTGSSKKNLLPPAGPSHSSRFFAALPRGANVSQLQTMDAGLRAAHPSAAVAANSRMCLSKLGYPVVFLTALLHLSSLPVKRLCICPALSRVVICLLARPSLH